MEEITHPRGAVGAATIAEAFRITAANRADDVAIRTKGDEVAWTWGELRERVDALAGGLAALGLERGETVALMLGNRPEFHLADLAVMMVGATPFSIYTQYTPEQIRHQVIDADARIAITEQQFLGKVLEARAELPQLEHVIVVDGEPPEGVLSLDGVAAAITTSTSRRRWRRSAREPAHAHLHLGDHRAAQGRAALAPQPPRRRRAGGGAHRPAPDGRVISWLPSAHVAERNAHHYLPIVYGLQITCCDNPREILGTCPRCARRGSSPCPASGRSSSPAWRRWSPAARRAARETGPACATRREGAPGAARRGRPGRPGSARRGRPIARSSAACAAMLGLDQVEGHPRRRGATPVEVLEFFHAIGLPLAELWGMSETCGAGAANPPERIKIGTVGPPARESR
jgi:long-subunit acyl-CoA synthetase (AMP-forming)